MSILGLGLTLIKTGVLKVAAVVLPDNLYKQLDGSVYKQLDGSSLYLQPEEPAPPCCFWWNHF